MIKEILSSAPMWGAVGAIVGSVATYAAATKTNEKDVFKEIISKTKSVEEVRELFGIYLQNGNLSKLDARAFEEVISSHSEYLPRGIVCTYVWCSLSGQVANIKRVYSALNLYQGPIDNTADQDFANATIAFQAKVNLEADGIVGAKTFGRIRQTASELGITF